MVTASLQAEYSSENLLPPPLHQRREIVSVVHEVHEADVEIHHKMERRLPRPLVFTYS